MGGQHLNMMQALRLEICQLEPEREIPLPEVELSIRFGVSRTPVRQALQALERQRLVEIRQGMGARVLALEPDEREALFLLYQDLEIIAAKSSFGRSIPSDTLIELGALSRLVPLIDHPTVQDYVDLGIRLHVAIARCVENEILHDTISTCYWRILRWRVEQVKADLDYQWENFKRNVRRLSDAGRTDDAGLLLRAVAGIAGDLAYPLNGVSHSAASS